MKIVGDDMQIVVVSQGAGKGFRRRSNIDEERSVVWNERGRYPPDVFFRPGVERLTGVVRNIFDSRCRARAAMIACYKSLIGKDGKVTPYGLYGDLELGRQVFVGDKILGIDQFDDVSVARVLWNKISHETLPLIVGASIEFIWGTKARGGCFF